MNILFVSMVPFESNTSATIQNKGIVKGLAELGHVIDTMTLELTNDAVSYDETMNDLSNIVRNSYYIELNPQYAKFMAKKPTNKSEQNGNLDSSNQLSIKLKKGTRSVIKKMYDNTSVFDAQKSNVNQVSKLKINYDSYDIIISASDPKSSHLIVEKIYKNHPKLKAKWIQYWGDPMFNDITRKKDWRNPLVKYYENNLIKRADKVVYASPLTLKIQKETFPVQANKMDYASQVFLNGTFENESVCTSIRTNATIGYFGAYHSKVRNIMPLYNATLDSVYNLNICGPSDLKLESTENIKVYGMVPYKEATKMEENSDILVTICNSSGTQIPGKIYYCSGYNKPIIVVLDGDYKEELRAYLETFDRYILCENDSDSILKAFEKATNELQDNKRSINEQLTPKYMGEKILEGLELTYNG